MLLNEQGNSRAIALFSIRAPAINKLRILQSKKLRYY